MPAKDAASLERGMNGRSANYDECKHTAVAALTQCRPCSLQLEVNAELFAVVPKKKRCPLQGYFPGMPAGESGSTDVVCAQCIWSTRTNISPEETK